MQNYAARTGKTLLSLGDYVLDTTTFATHHPGGKAILQQVANQPIDQQMQWHYPLSLLLANSMVIGTFKREINRVVDPQKPLVQQIWNMSQQNYRKAVNSPQWLFVPSPRMFQWQLFQFLSHSRWYQVAFLPAFVIMWMMVSIASWANFDLFSAIAVLLIGTLLFTLTQYCLHRFVFHAQWWLPENRVIRLLHFVLHGVHHMLPNDPTRLVLPPPFALIICVLAYPTVVKLLPITDPILCAFFWTGYLGGYVIYDSTHYFLHFLDTSKLVGTYFHRLQKYHNQHHYGGEHAGFGVSSKLWDIVFCSGFKNSKKSVKD